MPIHPVIAACALALATSQLAACGPRNDGLDGLRALRVANAEEDARRALARDDHRLLGVLGIACEVPSTDYMCSEAEDRYGILILEGTSDTPASGEEVELNQRARRYAQEYNAVVVREAAIEQ